MSEVFEAVIRVAETIDAPMILELCQQVGIQTDYLTFGPEGLDISVQKEIQLIEMYHQSLNSLLIVAEIDEKIIGMANITEHKERKQNHVAEIGICILNDYTGMGLATEMMEVLMEFAEQSDLKIITLEVVKENDKAIQLYKKFGFEKVGTLSKRLRVGDKFYDSYIMEKVLE